jgi:hypothetical protein
MRMPKSITGLVPFAVQRNKQIVSVPEHGTGLSRSQNIRYYLNIPTANTEILVSHTAILAQVLNEWAVTLPTTSRLTYTIAGVRAHGMSAGNIVMRLYDEPRNAVSAPFFEAADSNVSAGISHIAAIYPKAATYSVASTDEAPVLNRTVISVFSTVSQTVILDVTAAYTVKHSTGLALANTSRNYPGVTVREYTDSDHGLELASEAPYSST